MPPDAPKLCLMVENTAGQHATAADNFLYLAGTSTTGPSLRDAAGPPAEVTVEVGTLTAVRTNHDREPFGPFGPATGKPFSITRKAVDHSALLKIYRGVEPLARREREAVALRMAWQLGPYTPDVPLRRSWKCSGEGLFRAEWLVVHAWCW